LNAYYECKGKEDPLKNKWQGNPGIMRNPMYQGNRGNQGKQGNQGNQGTRRDDFFLREILL
jgi:hypothetical protein